ncbi:MAG: hypothetical protein WCL16_12320, partial [bacterium]
AQAATVAAGVKSATTRITLPTMPSGALHASAPKTIRLTRPGVRTAAPSLSPGISAMSASGRIAVAIPVSETAKRQTSRIPLEAAMVVPDVAPEASDMPKTLRLKRPDEEESYGSLEPSAEEGAATEHTPPDAPQPTQRKTIRIKRPTGKSIPLAVPRSMAVARIEAEAANRVSSEPDEQIGVLWPILAAVAIVVVCVLTYALAVQAMPAWGLSFPGQVV